MIYKLHDVSLHIWACPNMEYIWEANSIRFPRTSMRGSVLLVLYFNFQSNPMIGQWNTITLRTTIPLSRVDNAHVNRAATSLSPVITCIPVRRCAYMGSERCSLLIYTPFESSY